MQISELILDAFSRIHDNVHQVLGDADEPALQFRPDPQANTIAWLIWHLTRVQDDHIAGVAGTEQVWTANGWYDRSGLPFEPSAHGYGHSADDVAAVTLSADFLTGYHDEVHAATCDYVRGLTDSDLDRVVDDNWDPPVTASARIVSIIDDCAQHLGQAAYLRGIAP